MYKGLTHFICTASCESGASPINPILQELCHYQCRHGLGASRVYHAYQRQRWEGSSVQTAGVAAKLVGYEHNTIVDCTITKVQGDKCTFQYQPMSPGIHHLYVTIQGKDVHGSPQTIEVKATKPVRIITGLSSPVGVATDSKGRIIVTECGPDCVSIFTPEGRWYSHSEVREMGTDNLTCSLVSLWMEMTAFTW